MCECVSSKGHDFVCRVDLLKKHFIDYALILRNSQARGEEEENWNEHIDCGLLRFIALARWSP